MRAVMVAYWRALGSQLHGKILLLSIVPFLLSLALWAMLLYVGLQPLIDYLQHLFVANDGFKLSGSMLAATGLGMLKTIVVPLIAMLLLLPLMMLTALLFMGVAAMPAIVRHVGQRQFSGLDQKRGGSWVGSVATALGTFALFVLLWILTLPLYAFAPLALLAQTALWGWLTYRVLAYDALADYASDQERRVLMRAHRRPLLVIGAISGAAGAIPGIVWVGGTVLSVVLFPFLAAVSIWLYVVIFIFTGLWFEYYCLQALADQRRTGGQAL